MYFVSLTCGEPVLGKYIENSTNQFDKFPNKINGDPFPKIEDLNEFTSSELTEVLLNTNLAMLSMRFSVSRLSSSCIEYIGYVCDKNGIIQSICERGINILVQQSPS